MRKLKQAKYEQIALDIAARIAREDLAEGDRISGRSILSSEYSVSPETIRRSLNLLSEHHCVHVINNYGVVIGEKKSALAYLEKMSLMNDMSEMKHRLTNLMEQRTRIDNQINQLVQDIIDMSSTLNYTDPLKQFEFTLEEDSSLIDMSISASSFYQKTMMTIIAIHRKGETILSPGPDAIFKTNDILVVVGHPRDVKRVETLVQKSQLC
ncbi:TrkA C-terminal domain-containing protein [Erysipelothrix urinaevulpis]|uniref:TrkA C-terminal domain-containing protein n=1 Tax=Erysipelothrix urinaevulpis TaxID=2683717 RepID=UPI00135772C6|nr:TrkA C-terminal domain-containing protein [Erysipelothrix urinaevulpis]